MVAEKPLCFHLAQLNEYLSKFLVVVVVKKTILRVLWELFVMENMG